MLQLYKMMYQMCLLHSFFSLAATEKSVSRLKKIATNPSQKKPKLKLLMHQGKLEVSTKRTIEVTKGRMYDYNNARFLSVDPFIQGISSQALNPYTYIFNNPLSGVDPSGYIAHCDSGKENCDEPEEPNRCEKVEDCKDGKNIVVENGKEVGILYIVPEGQSGSGSISSIGSQAGLYGENMIAQNDTGGRDLSNNCLIRGICNGGIKNEYSVFKGDLVVGAKVATEFLDDPLVYLGGGVYKAAGTGLFFVVKGSKLVPFAKTIGLTKDAKFAQKSFRNEFSPEGIKEIAKITGVKDIRSVDQLSNAIVSGKINPADIHVNIVNRNGTSLILNTRSAHALEQAGIPRSSFTVIDRTGDEFFEGLLSTQLKNNNLTSKGTSIVKKEY